MTEIIGTTRNKTYKYVKALKQRKARAEARRFTVEGKKSVSDALRSHLNTEMIIVSDYFYKNEAFVYPDTVKTVVVKDELFSGLCDTKTPQGIMAVIVMPEVNGFSPERDGLYVYCDNVSDPGNLGTIIRTADAAGFNAVLLSPGCTDAYSPKTVRSSMGSFFNIRVITDVDTKAVSEMKASGYSLFCGALLSDSVPYTSADFRKPSVIIIGNEANGASDEILKLSEHIIIPIMGGAESLNAAVAGAIIMYEAVRQRSEGKGYYGDN
jgi:TrmH family RNA methyltransferase